jgi:hypothetical protein
MDSIEMSYYIALSQISRSRDSSVGIATGFKSGQGQYFSLLHSLQTSSEAQLAYYPGRQADHSPPSSTEVKDGGAIRPLPHLSSCHSA